MRYSLFLLFLLSSCSYNEIVPFCQPDEQIFTDIVQPLIEDNCMACHDESSGRPEILTTYDGVIDAVNNHSLRYQVTSLQMPPYGNDALSDLEINIIKNWIDCE
jgi:hypothetical protein